MKRLATLAVAVTVATSSLASAGDELVSGPQVGERVTGYFDIEAEKCGGAEDGYAVGSVTRYYCEYRGLVVLVFARTFDDGFASLVKEIDQVIEQNEEKEIASYVAFLGDDFDRVKAQAVEFGMRHKFDHVPLVVPFQVNDGPAQLRIHPDAEVTVIVYQLRRERGENKVVMANHAHVHGTLNEDAARAVVADIDMHLLDSVEWGDSPLAGLPVGRWNVEFANGVTEVCEVREDGTALVVEPRRTSGGQAAVRGGSVVIVYDDERVERWTPVRQRAVVEHWFPASEFPSERPVLGIAERAP